MITIIFAPPRTGKTCFLTYQGCQAAFDRERNRAMQKEVASKIAGGFDGIHTIPVHCVAANYDLKMRKFGYNVRVNRRINPFRLGYANPYVKTHFSIPYEFYLIDEAQEYFNSRMAMYYPSWQSRFFEQHGHNNLDFLLATHRPMLIDPNVRELSKFIDIVRLDKSYDNFGHVCRLKWHIRHIDNHGLFEKYIASGKRDTSCYTPDTVLANYNVFNCYDSQSCKPKFYDGHLHDDFDYKQAEPTDETLDGYIRYLREFNDELPENFYIRRKAA